MGGGISSDNITVHHLMNVKRVAYELRPFEPPKPEQAAKPAAAEEAKPKIDVEAIVRQVVQEVLAHHPS